MMKLEKITCNVEKEKTALQKDTILARRLLMKTPNDSLDFSLDEIERLIKNLPDVLDRIISIENTTQNLFDGVMKTKSVKRRRIL